MRYARELLHTPARKKRQRMRRVRIAAIAVGGLLISAGMLSWVTHMGQVRIAAVEITGNEALESDDIRVTVESALEGNYALLFPKDNAFFYPEGKILASLFSAFPRIKDAKVEREGLTKLAVSVDERAPIGTWCHVTGSEEAATEECYFLDDTGLIYATSPSFSESAYLTFSGSLLASTTDKIIGEYFLIETELANLLLLKDVLGRQGISIVAYEKGDDGDYRALIEQSGNILFNNASRAEDIALAITSAIEAKKQGREDALDEIDYVDARFLETGKVFVKFK